MNGGLEATQGRIFHCPPYLPSLLYTAEFWSSVQESEFPSMFSPSSPRIGSRWGQATHRNTISSPDLLQGNQTSSPAWSSARAAAFVPTYLRERLPVWVLEWGFCLWVLVGFQSLEWSPGNWRQILHKTSCCSCLFLGPHLAVFKAYSCLCAQGSLLAGLRNSKWCRD